MTYLVFLLIKGSPVDTKQTTFKVLQLSRDAISLLRIRYQHRNQSLAAVSQGRPFLQASRCRWQFSYGDIWLTRQINLVQREGRLAAKGGRSTPGGGSRSEDHSHHCLYSSI